jgi:hypothetical protein
MIYLSKSKNGDRRQVPLNRQARALLETPWPALEATRQGGRFLPFWDGRSDPKALAAHYVCGLQCAEYLCLGPSRIV